MSYTAATHIEYGHPDKADPKTFVKGEYHVGEAIDETHFTKEELDKLAENGTIVSGDQKMTPDQVAAAQLMMSQAGKAQIAADKAAAEAKVAADSMKGTADQFKGAKPTVLGKLEADRAAKADAAVKAHLAKEKAPVGPPQSNR